MISCFWCGHICLPRYSNSVRQHGWKQQVQRRDQSECDLPNFNSGKHQETLLMFLRCVVYTCATCIVCSNIWWNHVLHTRLIHSKPVDVNALHHNFIIHTFFFLFGNVLKFDKNLHDKTAITEWLYLIQKVSTMSMEFSLLNNCNEVTI